MPDTMGIENTCRKTFKKGKNLRHFGPPLCTKPETFTKEDLEKSFQREKKDQKSNVCFR